MARFSRGWRTAGAGSTALPIASLYATTAVRPRVVEIGCFNATTTAVNVAVARLTTAGTAGATMAGGYEDDNSQNAVATPKDTHSAGPTIGTTLRPTRLPSEGAGIIWTFGGGKTPGLIIPNSTGDGLGIIILTGTGQICDVWFVWDE